MQMQETRIWTDFQYFNEKFALLFYIHMHTKDAKNKKKNFQFQFGTISDFI